MKKFNVCVPRKYERNGEEKTTWHTAGTLTVFEATADKPEGFILELGIFPTTPFKIFEQKAKEDKGAVGGDDF